VLCLEVRSLLLCIVLDCTSVVLAKTTPYLRSPAIVFDISVTEMASSPPSSAMNLLEHAGITVATSLTTKAGIYVAAKIVETAKQMYNAPVELEALEEEIALVEAITRDTRTFLESPLCPSGLWASSQRLDSKLLEIAGFIETTLKKPDSSWADWLTRRKPEGDLEIGTSSNGHYLSPQGVLIVNFGIADTTYSANRWKWSQNSEKILELKSELAELRKKVQESLLCLNT
jgi:hypothetical protein